VGENGESDLTMASAPPGATTVYALALAGLQVLTVFAATRRLGRT
jgi:hypothetical protein